MSAKNPVMLRASVWVSDDGSGRADGISKIEVYSYFAATWRGQEVSVTMASDRYSASYYDESTGKSTNKLTPWRTYASEARYGVPEDGTRSMGENTTGTARSALSELCAPLVAEWLESEEFEAKFKVALARMVLRKFNENYGAAKKVEDALAMFKGRLLDVHYEAISAALDAYKEFVTARVAAEDLLSEAVPA